MTQAGDFGLEAPEADAAEQATIADPRDEEFGARRSDDIEAPDWDAQEQSQAVPYDDDYR